MKAIKNILIFVIIAVVVGWLVDGWRFSQLDKKQLSQPVVAQLTQQLTPAQGQAFDRGQPMLVYLWATWCGFCKTTSGSVSNIWGDTPVATVALQSGSASTVKQYLASKQHAFQFYNDHDGALTRAMGINVTPTFLIVDNTGEIKFMSVGMTTELSLRTKLAMFMP